MGQGLLGQRGAGIRGIAIGTNVNCAGRRGKELVQYVETLPKTLPGKEKASRERRRARLLKLRASTRHLVYTALGA